VSTQVNFEVKLADTGSIPSAKLEEIMKGLKTELSASVMKYLCENACVTPVFSIRGPIIMFLAD
jgi:hypothetical protein